MADAKHKKRASIKATVSDTRSEMTPPKKRGPYIRDNKLKTAFKSLLRRGLSVATVRKQLQADFPDARLPSDRTIERWAAEYRKTQGDVPWRWAGKDGDNWMLDVQTAVFEFTQGEGFISEKQAEALKVIHGLVPNMPPVPAWFFCQEILDTPWQDVHHIFDSLGFARRVSAKGEIARETIEAHVASHVRRWGDRPLVAWTPNIDVMKLYLRIACPPLSEKRATHLAMETGIDRQFLFMQILEEEYGSAVLVAARSGGMVFLLPSAEEREAVAPSGQDIGLECTESQGHDLQRPAHADRGWTGHYGVKKRLEKGARSRSRKGDTK